MKEEDKRLLTAGPERDEAMESHPFKADRQLFASKLVQQFFSELQRCIELSSSSLSLEAPSTHGKTTTYLACVELLRRHYPKIPAVFVTAKEHKATADMEKMLWGDWLADWKHPVHAGPSTSNVMRNLVLSSLRAVCDRADAQRFILWIDEAQNVRPEQWGYVKDLINMISDPTRMDRRKVLVVSAWQGSNKVTYETLLSTKRPDLITRFFCNHHRLKGLTSLESIQEALHAFDSPNAMQFPEDSQICYTEFYFPEAFAAGWRLASEARTVWKLIVKHWPSSSPVDLGMRPLMQLIRQFFLVETAEDSSEFRGSTRTWGEALESSRFRQYATVPGLDV